MSALRGFTGITARTQSPHNVTTYGVHVTFLPRLYSVQDVLLKHNTLLQRAYSVLQFEFVYNYLNCSNQFALVFNGVAPYAIAQRANSTLTALLATLERAPRPPFIFGGRCNSEVRTLVCCEKVSFVL